ncbi:flagellar hook-basal body protein [Dyella silvatica]|uniref:flagellar hook-basal body protein n=1 Tax=Dyella silvatica TaxID=2992128 RepID=UPI002254ADD6|nr:flagellar hook-basal body complex protein [Dyella silvatica]
MIDALYIAASGLSSQQQQIDVISNNLANMQTPGYKRSRVAFTDVSSLTPAQAQQGLATNLVGAGTQIMETAPVMLDGTIQQTNNTLDVAIQGAGFFEIESGDNERLYTRAGQLKIDSDGYLANATGQRLAQNIQIPTDATHITIASNGEIRGVLGSDKQDSSIGNLQLATFSAPEALRSVGGNNFATTPASGDAVIGKPGDAGFGSLSQGYVEGSNVDLVGEMSTLVLAQRAYQLNARVLQASDQILDTINNLNR